MITFITSFLHEKSQFGKLHGNPNKTQLWEFLNTITWTHVSDPFKVKWDHIISKLRIVLIKTFIYDDFSMYTLLF